MTSRWSRARNLLLLSPVVTGMLLAASGCATPRDRCEEYVTAMNGALEACGMEPNFTISDPRDEDRQGCRWVASIESPREVVRCVNTLNSIVENAPSNPGECDRLVDFPDNLPTYCDASAFGLVR